MPNLCNRIREWLGYENLKRDNVILLEEIRKTRRELVELAKQLSIIYPSLGRIIAKLDPLYGIPEDDPRRRADSDKLGADIIKKLLAEQAVINQYGYRPHKD